MERQYAIEVKNLVKNYGRQPVIRGLSLRVRLGNIYGLLGPSGCGKTTLLKCIVGRLQPDGGIVRVMGQRPGKLGHGVPGHLIGYMPQDLALYQEFTISETLFYFGRIFGMTSGDIEARVDFLVDLLKLPDKDRLIARLSGGQQRRASFACALLHQPPLLILDEPTVGVDPLLRQCIWQHLKAIVSNTEQPTSVVITTHYIEEAREGQVVALMRNGTLLAESSPESLLRLHNLTSLEAVFLKLCNQDSRQDEAASLSTNFTGQGNQIEAKSRPNNCQESSPHPAEFEKPDTFVETLKSSLAPPSPRRIGAVVVKDFTNMRRRIGFLLFEFSLPIVQIVLFCLCIGRDPAGLRLAIVNEDATGPMGVSIVNALDSAKIRTVQYSDLELAKADVRKASAWGVLYLQENFTSCLMQRFSLQNQVSPEALRQGSVQMYMDSSNYLVNSVIKQCIVDAVEKVLGDLLQRSGRPRSLAIPPIAYHQPLLGNQDATFTEFMAPGIIVTILFFLSTGLTAVTFVVQCKEGLLDRSLVAGVTVPELMLGHVLTELVIMSGQTALLLFFSLVVFGIRCSGSIALVILLALCSGFCGMSLGLLISALCTAENDAMKAALGTMYPSLLLSGIMWPAEGMPSAIWYISRALPTTLSVEAMRGVVSRGFGIAATSVWLGFVASIAWSLFMILAAMLLIKFKGF